VDETATLVVSRGGDIADPGDFEAAFREHFPAVYWFIARRVGTSLAEDLTAETFATAYRRRRTFRAELGTVRSWLYGIAVNILRNHWRAEQRSLEREARALAMEPPSDASDIIDQRVSAAALAPVLAGALASLNRRQRDVLLLHAWADLSYEEIGAALGIPSGTVRSRLSRARATLRAKLGDFNFDLWSFEGRDNER
jgi:RNA polymerase sigma factor (sigma-70 family)